MKKTVVFDFDGVIHSYSSGWKGARNIPDPPVPGIEDALREVHNAGYEVVIVSTRCATIGGRVGWICMASINMLIRYAKRNRLQSYILMTVQSASMGIRRPCWIKSSRSNRGINNDGND